MRLCETLAKQFSPESVESIELVIGILPMAVPQSPRTARFLCKI
jgi:hypothetical protein